MTSSRQFVEGSLQGEGTSSRATQVSLDPSDRLSPSLVVITGNPNTGKSTVFNALTGLTQHVANFPGVTVQRRTGWLSQAPAGIRVKLLDVPGAYSLGATSEDEAVVSDVLLGRHDDVAVPDVILVSVDATNLARNLFLVTQVQELGRPVVVALNMSDLAQAHGIEIDAEALSKALGCPVVPIVATKRSGLAELLSAIFEQFGVQPIEPRPLIPDQVEEELRRLAEVFDGQAAGRLERAQTRMEIMQALLSPGGVQEKRLAARWGDRFGRELEKSRARLSDTYGSIAAIEAKSRYEWIEKIVRSAVVHRRPESITRTEQVDRILTHRLFGLGFLLLVLCVCFQAIYTWAEPLMNFVDTVFAALSHTAQATLPDGAFASLIADGVIAGVGAVLVFLPQILILFLFLAILEDCGYLARAAFLLDRWMALIGLNGKALFPLLSSFACAVPGILAARTIENKRDRYVTILIAPLMSCSARLPVYVLLIGAMIPATPLLGGLVTMQAITLLGMYLVGLVVAIPIAWLLKRTIFRGGGQPFLMELPTYKWPSPGVVFSRMWIQGREFCVTAGTVIFAVSILIWALGYYPRSASTGKVYQQQRVAVRAAHDETVAKLAAAVGPGLNEEAFRKNADIVSAVESFDKIRSSQAQSIEKAKLKTGSAAWTQANIEADQALALAAGRQRLGKSALALWHADQVLSKRLTEITRKESGAYLRTSILGRMGRWIEPVVKPLGWDWRIGTAALASFPAREVFIATMGTIYNLGGEVDESSGSLRDEIKSAAWPDGKAVYNVPVALSLMVFFALCCQCGSTLATIKRELLRWRWAAFTFVYMTTLAYLGAWATYRIALHFV